MDPSGGEITFGLTRAVLAKSAFVEIDEAQFEAARNAKKVVVGALGIEETFNLVARNYLEYESELLHGALDCIVYTEGSWSDFVGRIHEVNRRLMNLLTAGRAYLDQAAHYLSSTCGADSPAVTRFRQTASAEYDARLGYRVMEELRNFALHRGVGVHSLSHANWSRDQGEDRVRYNALVPSILPKRLHEEGGFKATVLAELEALGETVDIRPLVKEYVVALTRVHELVRELVAPIVTSSDGLIHNLIARFKAEGEENTVGLAVVKCDPRGVWTDQVAVIDEPIARRRDLMKRTYRLKYLEGLYTTNEPQQTKKVRRPSSRKTGDR